jgi:hypothetical protein
MACFVTIAYLPASLFNNESVENESVETVLDKQFATRRDVTPPQTISPLTLANRPRFDQPHRRQRDRCGKRGGTTM